MGLDQSSYLAWLAREGITASLVTVTGTVCPCTQMARGEYSAAYHRDNPAPGTADCGGTGLISTTTTTTSIKGVCFPPGLYAFMNLPVKERKIEIGEYNKDDMIWVGTVNASTGVLVDISGKNELRDYITFNSINYFIRDVSNMWTGEQVGQMAKLVRKA